MIKIKLYLATIILIGNLSAETFSNCPSLLGSWEGSYTYPSNGFTNKYKVIFNVDHTSSEDIIAWTPNKTLVNHHQKGTWICDENQFTITVLTTYGDKVSTQYKFLETTPNKQKFQSYFKDIKDVSGPIFELKRIK